MVKFEDLLPLYNILSDDELNNNIIDRCFVTKKEGESAFNDLTDMGKDLGLVPFLRFENDRWKTLEHRHDYLELVFAIEGSAKHCLGKKEYTISKGDIFFINTDLPHIIRGTDGQQVIYANFSFLPEMLDQHASLKKLKGGMHFFLIEPFFRSDDNFKYKLTVNGQKFTKLVNLALLIIDTFNEGYPKRNPTVLSLFRSFVMLIHDEYEKNIPTNPVLHKKREAIFWNIIREIESRLDKKISISDIARYVGYGERHISNIFKEYQGETIIEYANRRRIEVACDLLKTTSMSITKIALEVGFNDLSYFNRIFKNITDTTPHKYRKSRDKK